MVLFYLHADVCRTVGHFHHVAIRGSNFGDFSLLPSSKCFKSGDFLKHYYLISNTKRFVFGSNVMVLSIPRLCNCCVLPCVSLSVMHICLKVLNIFTDRLTTTIGVYCRHPNHASFNTDSGPRGIRPNKRKCGDTEVVLLGTSLSAHAKHGTTLCHWRP